MKAFDSLTESELVALTDDDIQRYIDYACAENGVPLLPSLPPAPLAVSYEPDVKVYSVGHWLHFLSAEQAARVMEAISEAAPVELDYLSVPSGVPSHAISNRRPSVQTVTVDLAFSAARAAELKDALSGQKRAEDVYEKAKKDYDRAVSERESYAAEIREAVETAWGTHRRRESLRHDYERYLSLADGNAEIAARFLANANKDARQLLPDLFGDAAGDDAPSPAEVQREHLAQFRAPSLDDGIPF